MDGPTECAADRERPRPVLRTQSLPHARAPTRPEWAQRVSVLVCEEQSHNCTVPSLHPTASLLPDTTSTVAVLCRRTNEGTGRDWGGDQDAMPVGAVGRHSHVLGAMMI